MESPKRRALKSRDYRRHRMMRLLNRRKATAQEAMSEIAERELMRRLRITPLKKFEDGKDAEYERVDDNTPGMTGMMKAALATAAHFGNPTARRMTNYDTRSYVWPDEYEEDGIFMEPKKGNVYVASYDNLVTPRIQDTGNGLTFVNNVWSPENEQRSYSQSLKFNNEEDARYFGEHYKEISPMMHLYTGGGTAVSQNPYYVNIKNYPVVNAEDEGLSEYFMNHKDVAGMAIGGGANGIDGPRRIVMNPYSDVLKTDLQKEGLVRIEAVRHAMDEYNYKPSFELSEHQKNLQKTVFKDYPYGSNDEAFKKSIISRILVGDADDLQPTPEQEAEAARFIFNNDSDTTKKPKKFRDGKDAEYDAGVLDDVVITGKRRPANIMFDKDTGNYYRESTGDVVTPVNKLVEDDPSTWSFTDKNGTTFTPHGPVFNSNQGEIRLAEEAPFLSNNYIKRAAHNYMSELAYDINNNRVVGGKYTMPAIALAPFMGSKIGGAAINSAFAAHGLNHAVNEGIDGFGDAVTTGLELIPLSQLAKPAVRVAGRAVERGVNSVKNKIPWTYRIPENPNMAYRRMGPLERDWLMEGNELSTRSTNALTEAEEEAARTAATRSGRRFTLFKAGAEHGGRKQFAKGQPWNGTTVTHGEEQILAIPGKGLPWVSGRHFRGPQGNGFGVGEIPFEEAPFGSHIDLLTEEGYTGVNPSLLEGSVIYSPFKVFGRDFGYKKLYPKSVKSLKNRDTDTYYKAAVESGNRPEALRLLEQAYLESGIPKTDITITPEGHAVGWYHGSEWGNHTIFDSSAMNATIGGTSARGRIKGNFLTTDVPSAMRYAGSSRYSSADVPEYTSPITFGEKIKKLFGRYKPRRLYPAERVGDLAPKPERLFDTEGKAPINHLEKTDNVVYPMYVNPGEDVMTLDFQGNPWSKSPVIFPNNFYLRRHIRDDIANTFRDEIIPYNDYESAYRAWMEDPINIRHGSTSLDEQYFDDGTRSILGFNSAPRYEKVRLVEDLVPNTTNGAVQTAAKEGKTSVLMRNVIDSNGGPEGVGYAIDDFVTLKPNQQKLADITYDDNGKLIPLSQRFNWFKDDIRYGLLPFGIGFGGLGLINKNNRFK